MLFRSYLNSVFTFHKQKVTKTQRVQKCCFFHFSIFLLFFSFTKKEYLIPSYSLFCYGFRMYSIIWHAFFLGLLPFCSLFQFLCLLQEPFKTILVAKQVTPQDEMSYFRKIVVCTTSNLITYKQRYHFCTIVVFP